MFSVKGVMVFVSCSLWIDEGFDERELETTFQFSVSLGLGLEIIVWILSFHVSNFSERAVFLRYWLQDGVILGADTRATEGEIVCDKNCEKIHYLAPNIYCCGAGTAADTENVTGESHFIWHSSNLASLGF
jgi:hypothetical protein